MTGCNFIQTPTLSQLVQAMCARYHRKVMRPTSHLSQDSSTST